MKVNLFCREAGFGPPLILLHGNGEDGTYFASQIEFFEGRYRVIAPDMRGHGRTPRATAQLAIIPGTHFVAAEEPAAFNAVVAGFLDGVG